MYENNMIKMHKCHTYIQVNIFISSLSYIHMSTPIQIHALSPVLYLFTILPFYI